MKVDANRVPGGVDQQIPRLSLALLMLAQAAVIVPHGAHLSLWIIAVGLVCAGCRWMVFQGRWAFPPRWLKVTLVAAGAAGVMLDGRGPFSLETATALLLVAFAFKLVEMRSRRDAYVVIFLCYFVIAAEFLFDQSIAVACYEFIAMVIVTAAMVGLNQMHARVRPVESLKTAATLVLQALPLMLVLFLFFPRIAPLWSVPLPGGAQTGISDRVAPGDIARLTQSDEIAMRVNFEGPIPDARDLYWRGMVYSNYDAGVWSLGVLPQPTATGNATAAALALPEGVASSPVRYEVLQEPTRAVWLFALEMAEPASDEVFLTGDYRLVTAEALRSLFRFRAVSYLGLHPQPELPDWLRRRETRVPAAENPRARDFAQSMWQDNPVTAQYLDSLLRHIRQAPFRYTLQPPLLTTRDSIDEFWFESRAGFCSHYAGAFVYLARLAGIPARMVGGYQGGEVNPVTGHLVVRQYDAHAWAEAWLPGVGWMRYDPTGAVAPARIERGFSAALSLPDRAALAAFTSLRLDRVPGLADLLFYLESVEHRWNVWVVGYDGPQQHRYLSELMGNVSPALVGIAMLSGGAASLALVALTLFWRRRRPKGHPAERLLRKFFDGMARAGVVRPIEETPTRFLWRIAARAGRSPQQTADLVESLDRLLYNPAAVDSTLDLRRLKRGLRRLQLETVLRASS